MTVTIESLFDRALASLGLPPENKVWVPYLYRFNGFEFGHATDYIVESVTGILGFNASSDDFRSQSGPGAIPGMSTLEPRVIGITIKVDAQAGEDAQSKIDALMNAFSTPSRVLNTWVGDYQNRGYYTDTAMEFLYYRPGWSEGRFCYGRVTKFNIDSNFETGSGFISCDVEITCPDPRAYGYTTYVLKLDSGDTYNWKGEGNYPDGYPPFCKPTGSSPSLSKTYQSLYFPSGNTLTVSLDDSVTSIDMRNRLIDPIVAGAHVVDKAFWAVKSGPQTIAYSGGGQCEFYIRSCWL